MLDTMMHMPRSPFRRQLLTRALLSVAGYSAPAAALPAKTLVFPRDRGAHPDFKTEWWYVTGQTLAGQRLFGFQLTFFRSRVDSTQGMASKFAAKQLFFAHAAITDVVGKKLWHDQRIARGGFGVAQASQADMDIKLSDWTLQAQGNRYQAHLPAADFGLKLALTETQNVLLQGQQGLSRKGPDAQQASYYYSHPQLATSGSLRIKDKTFDIQGIAWLDHEWSQELLSPGAIGWDWIGMNLTNGSALTAFRLRDTQGQAVWDGGSFRPANGQPTIFSRGDVHFTPTRLWTSPLTQNRYPVEWTVRTPLETYTVKAVIDSQELDSRQSTGAIYWEGLSDLIASNGALVGRGYLEMTGYGAALRM